MAKHANLSEKGYYIMEIEDIDVKSRICRHILNSLPEWFGIPEAIDDYTRWVRTMTFYACYAGSEPVGFAALKAHNSKTAELSVMGVLKEHQRKGIGRSLVNQCVRYCIEKEYRFLTVKTLAEDNPDEYYARTRQFYLSMGFTPLEVFTTIWDENNPCLFMVKVIPGR
ncbi:MAG TPA: GNAT family N-acetyltransferase [Candidatus Atribacteria bacterium]|nr:GNAT family N-acetyltransferase [Candidatus Atribacteria bacterium]HPT78615.1 GNAT family N-acetyltransferase [Candidatus Atribacteria bacterium]